MSHNDQTVDNEVFTEGQEILSPALGGNDPQTASEIERMIAMAERRPRKLSVWKNRCLSMITLAPEIAEECFYALPRKERNKTTGKIENKIITGPSARFAEIIVANWGNCRAIARVAGEDQTGNFICGQGTFHDVEMNFFCGFEVQRRITTSSGKKYSADMIQVTGNAAASIAYRNAALKGIPGALWKPLLNAAKSTAVGNITTLTKKRDEIMTTFTKMGLTQEQIFQIFDIKGKDDIDGEKLIEMKGLENALKNGDANLDDVLAESMEQNPAMFKNRDKVQDAVSRAQAAAQAQAPTPEPETKPGDAGKEPPPPADAGAAPPPAAAPEPSKNGAAKVAGEPPLASPRDLFTEEKGSQKTRK